MLRSLLLWLTLLPVVLSLDDKLVVDTITRRRSECNPQYPSFDGRCTNTFFRQYSQAHRPLSSISLQHDAKQPVHASLPYARNISNIISDQNAPVPNARGLSELCTFFGQFVDHTVVATSTGTEPMDIPILPTDPVFANFSGKLEFRRSKRQPVDPLAAVSSLPDIFSSTIAGLIRAFPSLKTDDVASRLPRSRRRRRSSHHSHWWRSVIGLAAPPDPNERPTNNLSSALDLSSVYGISEHRREGLRSFRDGKLKTSAGNLLPLNTEGLGNDPTNSAEFFVAGDHRASENPVLLSIHLIFAREHNLICEEIKRHFPWLSDESLYVFARRVNIAQFQKIVFDEYFPAMTGFRMSRYRGFKWWKNGDMMVEFVTAAFRVGHTMVGNNVNLRGWGGFHIAPIPFASMFFRKAADMPSVNNLIRGAVYAFAEEIDLKVHDSIRNFLFFGIPNEGERGKAFDLVALNIQRGRDHGLPSFNNLRYALGLRKLSSFADLTDDLNAQSRLQTAYGHIDDVEAWPGLVAEKKLFRSSMGVTMYRIWRLQFENLRDGDALHYKRLEWGALREKLRRIDRLYDRSGRSIFKDIIIRNTEIDASDIPDKVFFKHS